MKKIIAIILTIALALSMTACGNSAPAAEAPAEEAANQTEFKVAIIQQLDHSSLDEIRTAIEAKLNARFENKAEAVKKYLTEHQTVVNSTVVRRDGLTVSLICSESVDKIVEVYGKY